MERLDPEKLKRFKPEQLRNLLRATKRDQIAHFAIAVVLPVVAISEVWSKGVGSVDFVGWVLVGVIAVLTTSALRRYGVLAEDRENIEALLDRDE